MVYRIYFWCQPPCYRGNCPSIQCLAELKKGEGSFLLLLLLLHHPLTLYFPEESVEEMRRCGGVDDWWGSGGGGVEVEGGWGEWAQCGTYAGVGCTEELTRVENK